MQREEAVAVARMRRSLLVSGLPSKQRTGGYTYHPLCHLSIFLPLRVVAHETFPQWMPEEDETTLADRYVRLRDKYKAAKVSLARLAQEREAAWQPGCRQGNQRCAHDGRLRLLAFLAEIPSPCCETSVTLCDRCSVGTQTIEDPFQTVKTNLLQTKAAQDRMDRMMEVQAAVSRKWEKESNRANSLAKENQGW